jgi:hypothetical protein
MTDQTTATLVRGLYYNKNTNPEINKKFWEEPIAYFT